MGNEIVFYYYRSPIKLIQIQRIYGKCVFYCNCFNYNYNVIPKAVAVWLPTSPSTIKPLVD